MAAVRIVLQPPPNVDFVVGYPGIPPGARDRPQAAVKGALEVRVGPQGAKAKWVRVELKKIEVLPGGGQANSYYDHVGQSPVILWQSSEEYSLLHSQDFPFLIRIPESIPPSIALEKGAGIRYELVATACTLGQKSFFRRRKTTVVSQVMVITIDKHELHSTWPVYSQPESRSTVQDNVRLTVERSRTCFGPGDRVSVTAIVRADGGVPVVLRGFEFTLRETTVFRAGPRPSSPWSRTSRHTGPQVRISNVGEQKVPLSTTLLPGTQHKAEMGCLIPNTHTTTSLNAARHIDITYVVVVRANLGTSQPIELQLPVIVSNWPRNVSEEAVRRIGPAPSLCVMSPSSTAPTVPITTGYHHSNNVSTINYNRPMPKQSIQYTAPNGHGAIARRDQTDTDEFGVPPVRMIPNTTNHPGYGFDDRNMAGHGKREEGPVSTGQSGNIDPRPVGRRPGTGGSTNQQNRLTVTNFNDGEMESLGAAITEMHSLRRGQRAWPSAEDEKKQLYERAVAKVEKVQGAGVMANVSSSADPVSPDASPKRSAPGWMTAEDEKIRLYEQAQATAKRTQAFGAYSPSLRSRTSSDALVDGTETHPSRGGSLSAGVMLYQQAVSSMRNKPSHNKNQGSRDVVPPPTRTSPPPRDVGSGGGASGSQSVPHYPSAEDEKKALRMYYEAKLAVDRSQNTEYASKEGIGSLGPASYDVLYPQGSGASGSGSGAGTGAGGSRQVCEDLPPPFEEPPPDSALMQVSEKERLRQYYETQDKAQGSSVERSSPTYSSPMPKTSYAGPPPMEDWAARGLGRRDEGQDAVAPPMPPPMREPAQSPPLRMGPIVNGSGSGGRAQPVPPPTMNGMQPLTANEEKARLRAKYEAEERQGAQGYVSPRPPPPPRVYATESAHGHPYGYARAPLHAHTTSVNGFADASRHPYATAGAIPNGLDLSPSPSPRLPSSSSSPPPPLMPRPPAEYILQTQEEDMDLRLRYRDELYGADMDMDMDGGVGGDSVGMGVNEALQGLPMMRPASRPLYWQQNDGTRSAGPYGTGRGMSGG